ncbi:hypothetical protein [Thermoplasma acidophilum]|uniref:Antitoxin SocA-like Panacea domain-containing protein n=1 Tax=Thermoplasma acidophilum (strain ATCC 25905 / DSM 1728 / JCM 9062 / NBRC 15155 / AMRC-C165) TaxID=273075 RepID=Q9HK81_THEAC|nr:hypothetical protein [Thermoplasma acidophilum]MCY0852304.1 hypothetical protein [Thermoplasma acidophilum]CAC11858.1 hypothetical protein [Thermoplasma acidophilum]
MVTKSDLLLSFIYSCGRSKKNNEPIPSVTHLQEEIFLLFRSASFSDMMDSYHFEPRWYGPFSMDLSRDLTDFKSRGLISFDELRLTDKGFKIAASIWNSLDDFERQQICEVKAKYNHMSLPELIDTAYSMYPKFIKKSVIDKEAADKYFSDFLEENKISEEDVISAVNLAKKAMRH